MRRLIIVVIALITVSSANAVSFTENFESYTVGNDIISAGNGRYMTFAGTDLGYVRQSSDPENPTKVLQQKQLVSTNLGTLTRIVAGNFNQQAVGKVLCQCYIKPVAGSHGLYFGENSGSGISTGPQIWFEESNYSITVVESDPNRALNLALQATGTDGVQFAWEPSTWYCVSLVVHANMSLGQRGSLLDVTVTDLTNGHVIVASASNLPCNANPAFIGSGQLLSQGNSNGSGGYNYYEAEFDNWEITATVSNCGDIQLYGTPLNSDLNGDCKVNFRDFALLAATWLGRCNNPTDSSCLANW